MPRRAPRRHATRHLARLVYGQPWAILPQKLDQIVDLLELRRSGEEFTPEEIAERIGAGGGLRAQYSPAPGSGRPYWQSPAGVAVILIEGVLAPKMNLIMEISGGTSTQEAGRAIEAAAADPKVRAIVLAIDSPGGSVLGMAELAAQIRQAAGVKRVVAVVEGLGTSAAYYVASAASEVVASPSSSIGSIGVLLIHTENARADREAGTTRTVIRFGARKADGNPAEPLGAEAKASLQAWVDGYGAQFVEAVAGYRGVPPARVRERFGDGKVFIASEALERGMIDRIATTAQVIDQLGAAAGPATGPGATLPNTTPGADAAPDTLNQEEVTSMDPRLVEFLRARGLITANATAETARAVVATWYGAQGLAPPEGDDAILADLQARLRASAPTQPAGTAAQTPATSTPATPTPAASTPAASTQPARSAAGTPAAPAQPAAPDPAPAAGPSALEERHRIREITARGRLLHVAPEAIDQAIDAGTPLDAFLEQSTRAAVGTETPVQRVEPGPAAADKFGLLALAGLSLRCNLEVERPEPEAQQLQYRPLIMLAEECLRVRGLRPYGDPSAIALQALASAGGEPQIVHGLPAPLAQTGPAHGVGNFPGVLSALAGRILTETEPEAESTFREWASQIDDLPDFKPKTIWATGQFGELPEHRDGTPFDESTIGEEGAWIQADEYGDEFKLTPAMVVNDDLSALTEILPDQRTAHDATLNRLCVNILIGSPILWWDGNALFDDTNHGNDVAGGSGGAPSTAQLTLVRKKLRKQKGVGGKRALNYGLRHLVVPSDLETATEQTVRADLMIIPTAETSGQVFKGKVTWSVEPMLDDDSTVKWYAFGPARSRAIIYAFQRGYRSMRVVRYFQNETQSLVYQCTGRFCAAPRNYRGVLRNAGA